jgi:hypothetical protein
MEGLRRGSASMGADACHRVLLMDRLLDSAPLFLTGNTDTVYGLGVLDLATDGPTVIEVPRGAAQEPSTTPSSGSSSTSARQVRIEARAAST